MGPLVCPKCFGAFKKCPMRYEGHKHCYACGNCYREDGERRSCGGAEREARKRRERRMLKINASAIPTVGAKFDNLKIDGLEEAQRRWPNSYIISDVDPTVKLMIHDDHVVAKWAIDPLNLRVKLVMMLRDPNGIPEE